MKSLPRFPSATAAGRTLALLVASLLPVASVSPVAAQDQLTPAAPAAAPAMSDSDAPVVIVTIGSLGELMTDVQYVGTAVGQPQAASIFSMMASQFIQGIDLTQPIGIVVPIVDGAPEPIGMLPTADVRTVLKRLEAQTGPPDVLDDGTMVMSVGANTIFIRQVGPWAMVARSREVLDAAPADPTAVIAEMGEDYDLGIKLDVQQIPEAARDALMAQIRQGFDQTMDRQENATDEARKAAQMQIDQLEDLIKQTNELVVGLDIDSAAKRIVMDVAFDAVPGSEFGQTYAGQAPIASAYAGVIRPDAAGYFHAASSVSPEVAEQAKPAIDQMIATLRSALAKEDKVTDAEAQDITGVADRIAELILATYREGKFDAGAVLLTEGGKLQFASGSYVADGNEAAGIVQEIAAKVKGRGDAPTFRFNTGEFAGVTMHEVEADVPADQDELIKILGPTLKLHLGTGPKSLYVALGDDSLPLMKQMITDAASPSAPMEQVAVANFRMGPVLEYSQTIEADEKLAAMLTAIRRSDDGGQMSFETKQVANGQATRIIIGDGVLQAIGAVVRESQKAAMQQGGF